MHRVVAMILAAGCGGAGAPDGALEIGRVEDGAFRPLGAGEPLPLRMNTNGGIDLVTIDVRAPEADPRAPEIEVTATVEGILLGADLATGAPADMEAVGGEPVLRDVNVGLSSASCCHVCREAEVEARLVDGSGRAFAGSARVVLARGACPDPGVCCPSADYCVEPSLTQVCE